MLKFLLRRKNPASIFVRFNLINNKKFFYPFGMLSRLFIRLAVGEPYEYYEGSDTRL